MAIDYESREVQEIRKILKDNGARYDLKTFIEKEEMPNKSRVSETLEGAVGFLADIIYYTVKALYYIVWAIIILCLIVWLLGGQK